jgi:hypothetical protein
MNESENKVIIYLRITKEIHAAMKKIAEDESRTLVRQINHALSQWIDLYIKEKTKEKK